MSDVTRLLAEIERGSDVAAQQLLPVVYEQLRQLATARLANERPGQTLQATALVHEAYLRLVGSSNAGSWESRGHFFAAAAEAMRRILIENARRAKSLKRGGEWDRVEVELNDLPTRMTPDQLIDLHEALEAFGQEYASHAKLVELRYFGGMTIEQAAEVLEISRVTAHRRWAFARAWLFQRLQSVES